MILIPIFVAGLVPSLSSYRGLSGLDTGIFAFAAIMLIEEALRDKNWQSVGLYSALFVGMLGKIAWEYCFGGTLFVESSGFSPVPIAHIVGAVVGILVGGVYALPKSWFSSVHARPNSLDLCLIVKDVHELKTFMNSNLVPSNSPLSLSLISGITSRAINESVIKGARSFEPIVLTC